MAKTPNHFASGPSPQQADPDGDGFVEMDRFPPRRGNQKESRRMALILGGSVVVLAAGFVLKPIVAPEIKPTAEIASPPLVASGAPRNRFLDDETPVSVSGRTNKAVNDKAAKTGTASPFDTAVPAPGSGTSGTAGASGTVGASPTPGATTSTPDLAITRPYNPFGTTRPAASQATQTATMTTGTSGKAPVYGAADEPPITPSLSRTGGVYKPGAYVAPPPAGGTGMNTPAIGGTSYLPNTSSGTDTKTTAPGSGGASNSSGAYVSPRTTP